MIDSKILPLFPINVTLSKLGRKFTENEKKSFVENQKIKTRAVANYFSTNNKVLEDPNLLDLKSFIQQKLDFYLKEIISPISKSVELYITESWLAETHKDQHHHAHSHSNSIISGVLYIDTIEKNGIQLFSPHKSIIDISRDNRTKDYKFIELIVSDGDLILFPSYLMHSVKKNNSNKTRLSLAFNSFVKGDISTLPLNKLKI